MAGMNSRELQPTHVQVQFSDGTYSFLLPAGATLMELADKVDDLSAMRNCAPIAIHVDFDISAVRPSTKAAARNVGH